jgi:glycosyltransferase involved in cell wall biosynthesis
MNKKKLRVLFIAPYSKKAYGAEEQDIQWGLKILKKDEELKTFSMFLNLEEKKFEYSLKKYKNISQINIKMIFRFILIYLSAFDNSMRQAFTYYNYLLVSKVIEDYKIDVVVTNTSSTLLYGIQRKAKHIYRSVSFEPIYVRKVVNNLPKAMAHSFIKYLSLLQEFKADLILVISPRDKKYYSQALFNLPIKKLIVIPLRQFAQQIEPKTNTIKTPKLDIGFMGSTYSVLHNKRSFDFIINKVAPLLRGKSNVTLNIYGRKVLDKSKKYSNVKIHNWVDNINDIYSLNNCFVVPYFLASGMQSKVFEPLLFGKILICDPRVLSGFKFIAGKHYIPARDAEEFYKAIIWIQDNPIKAIKIGENGCLFAQKIIGPKIIKFQMKHALETVMGYKENI